MYGAALRGGGGAVDRRTHQRVVQGDDVAVDAQQARALELVERGLVGVEAGGGRADHGQPGGVVGRGDEQQPLGLFGEPSAAIEEGPLDPAGQRQRTGQRHPSGELVDREQAGQLDECEGVAAGGGHQLVAHLLIDAFRDLRGQQRVRIGARHGADLERRQVGGLETSGVAVAGGEDQCHALVLEPARREQQRRSRGLVEPVRVVDHDEHRRLLGSLGEQGQRAQVHKEPLALARGGAECGAQGVPLRLRKRFEASGQWPEKPLESGERQR